MATFSLLLDLPPELRDQVYLNICISPTQPILLTRPPPNQLATPAPPTPNHHPPPLPTTSPLAASHLSNNPILCTHSSPLLLLTCSQVYHEIRPLYWRHNAFSLRLTRQVSSLDYFLAPDFRDARLEISSFRLLIIRWGPKTFFADVLAPAISDMILNGRLRILEIRMLNNNTCLWLTKGDQMASATWLRPERQWQYQPSPSSAAVDALKDLCRDPYLESLIVAIPLQYVLEADLHLLNSSEWHDYGPVLREDTETPPSYSKIYLALS